VSDLTPQSKWKRRKAELLGWWSRTQFRRAKVAATVASVVQRVVTLAISLVGAILVAYGVWSIFEPLGYVTGGLLLWGIQWNYGNEEGRR
jgi:hypothetical protein